MQRSDQLVSETLVVPLGVVVTDVFVDRGSEMIFSEGDYPVEALLLDREHETLGMGVQIRAARRE